MNNSLDKLKFNINKTVVLSFKLDLLEQMKFVPISVKENIVYIAINPFADKENISLLAKKMFSDVKFIQLSDEEINDLLIYISSNIFSTDSINTLKDSVIEENLPVLETVENIEPEVHQKKLGEILISKGLITETQLVQALAEGKKQDTPLGSMLYTLGLISVENLKDVLSKQQGFDFVDAEKLNIQDKVVNILPEDFIRANQVVPISTDGKNLVVGMVNPKNPKVLKDIVYLTGQKPLVKLITYYDFQTILKTVYSHSKKETKKIIQQIEEEAIELDGDENLWEQVERELQESSGSVAKFVNKIITDAIENKASDIHIEPRIENYVVRYRLDGILRHVIDVPSKVEQAVLTRFKVLARMNIAEHRRPQDGSFSIKYKGNSYDLRINTLPVSGKEKVVIRVLAPVVSITASEKDIHLVGATKEDLDKIKRMASCPNGIILTSGPTGSGKTTTLYSILKSLNSEGVNITTIEDPVEIKLEGINQAQVNSKAGITFASCMRTILRQDPDVILIGEIRDYETLEVAISASLTGHLVLSTVHTNSAATTVTRLIEMGAKDYLVSSTLSGIIAQRLVRKLCEDCKEAYYPSKEEVQNILIDDEEIDKLTKTKLYKAKGCTNCNFTGYKGRLGFYEIMQINKEIKKLVAIGAHDIEIEETAIACGMKTLNQACLGHILKGLTTIDEFIRVLGIVSE